MDRNLVKLRLEDSLPHRIYSVVKCPKLRKNLRVKFNYVHYLKQIRIHISLNT